MAYALKYYQNFHQIKDYSGSTEWRIELYLDGYGGGSSEIDFIAANSIVLSRDGELLENVLGTVLTFNLYNETEGQYKEFRDADWGDYQVKLIKDPSGTPLTKFIGYNQSEIYTESYNQPPYTSKLEFTCGLSHLKHIRFDDSGVLYTGQKTIIEVLRLCLNKLPNPINIREFVGIYEDSITSGTTSSMMNQIYVDVSVYKEKENKGDDSTEVGFFCYKVIEEILKPFQPVQIYQANGIWYIIRTQENLDSTMYYREFNPNVGSESTVTIDATGNFTSNKRSVTGVNGASNELVLVAPETEMSIDPALNRVQVTYNQENLDANASNILKNGCFDSVTVISGSSGNVNTPDFWTINGDNWDNYNSFFNSGGASYWQFETTNQATISAYDSTKYITQSKTNLPTATADSLQFGFSVVLIGRAKLNNGGNINNSPENFFKNSLEFTWEAEIKLGTYYLSGDPTNGYSWTTTPSRAKFIRKGLPIEVDTDTAIMQKFDIQETLPTLPQNAIVDFSIKIYKPYHNWAAYASTNSDYTLTFTALGHRCFKIVYLPDELPPVEELKLFSKINEDENVEEIEVIHGDGANSVTLNSFRISTGVITDSWTRLGKADNTGILTVMLRQLRDLRSTFLKVLSGTIRAEIDIFNTIEHTTDEVVVYWIKSYEWSICEGEYNVELMELRNDSETSLTINTGQGLADILIGNGNGGGSAQNNDPIGNQSIVTAPTVIQLNQTNLNNYN